MNIEQQRSKGIPLWNSIRIGALKGYIEILYSDTKLSSERQHQLRHESHDYSIEIVQSRDNDPLRVLL